MSRRPTWRAEPVAGVHHWPRPSMTSRNALGVDAGERCWAPVNERQGTETRLASAARSAEGIPESPVNVEAISRTGHKGRREIW